MMWKYLYVFVLWNIFGFVLGQYEGEQCQDIDNMDYGTNGICTHIKNCSSAKEMISNGKRPKICTFEGIYPLVCCLESNHTPKEKTKPTFLSIENNDPIQVKMEEDNCPPIPDKYLSDPENEIFHDIRTTNKTGQVAWDKCIEYQRDLVFPCLINNETQQLERVQRCAKLYFEKSTALGSNGVNAKLHEFSHMALLGYGALDLNEWLCGGTIISDKFILTAGHCVYSTRLGNVTRVATGFLKRSDLFKTARIYNVTNIITHPDYKPPSKYNDIALLEIDGMHLDEYLVPACLHTGDYPFKTGVLAATGWGALWYKGDRPNILQKMILKEFTAEACKKQFPPGRNLKRGYDDVTQLCYGDQLYNTDTCDGDSGGPLQMIHSAMHCMHLVVGVTSFGTHCGVVNQPAVYTRVKPYVPWIEGIVWPK